MLVDNHPVLATQLLRFYGLTTEPKPKGVSESEVRRHADKMRDDLKDFYDNLFRENVGLAELLYRDGIDENHAGEHEFIKGFLAPFFDVHARTTAGEPGIFRCFFAEGKDWQRALKPEGFVSADARLLQNWWEDSKRCLAARNPKMIGVGVCHDLKRILESYSSSRDQQIKQVHKLLLRGGNLSDLDFREIFDLVDAEATFPESNRSYLSSALKYSDVIEPVIPSNLERSKLGSIEILWRALESVKTVYQPAELEKYRKKTRKFLNAVKLPHRYSYAHDQKEMDFFRSNLIELFRLRFNELLDQSK